jgi:ABC-type enterochelin transport system permease subunit
MNAKLKKNMYAKLKNNMYAKLKKCKCQFYATVILLYEHNFYIFQVVKLMKVLSLKHHQCIDRHLELHLKYFNVADRK